MIQDKPNAPTSPTFHWSDLFETWGGLVALIALVAFCALFPKTQGSFLKVENILNILNQNSFVGIVAIGMTFVIISGGIDLSVGSMVALVGGASIEALNWTYGKTDVEWLGVAIACAVAPLAGAALGFFNGVLISKGRIAPFIVTLAGLAGFRSIILAWESAGQVASKSMNLFEMISSPAHGIPLPELTDTYGNPFTPHITWPIILFVILAVLAQIVLSHTRYGRYTIAIGSNETAARYSAINVDRVRILTYTLIGLCAGISALLLASRMNSIGSADTGQLMELDAIAAVVVGGTRMSGGKGRIWGTVIGVLLLGVITNLLGMADVSVYWQGLVKAGVILLAVLLQRSKSEG